MFFKFPRFTELYFRHARVNVTILLVFSQDQSNLPYLKTKLHTQINI